MFELPDDVEESKAIQVVQSEMSYVRGDNDPQCAAECLENVFIGKCRE